ncbi:hypothetical protein [Aureimonas altamirensis]|uniref:hypothetical protein n=1 Tax=Aureimonas altamirensis TaxID=370622 RepID=UPI00301A4473
MSQATGGLSSLIESPLTTLILNIIGALVGAALVSLAVKTLARTVSSFAWIKANREISKGADLAARLRERDPTRMQIALIVQQFSVYIVLSLFMTGAAIACLASHGSRFDAWFPLCVGLIALLFQKTHEDYARSSDLLQMKHPGIAPIEARVHVFYLALTPEQKHEMDHRLGDLRASFASLRNGGPHGAPGAPGAQPA